MTHLTLIGKDFVKVGIFITNDRQYGLEVAHSQKKASDSHRTTKYCLFWSFQNLTCVHSECIDDSAVDKTTDLLFVNESKMFMHPLV